MWNIFHGCRLFFPVVHPVKLGFVEFFFSPFFFQLSIWWFRSVAEYLVLENPFLKISFLRISPTTGFPPWIMSEISTIDICIHTRTNFLLKFQPKKIAVTKTSPPPINKTPVAPTVDPRQGRPFQHQSIPEAHLAAVGCIWRSCGSTFGWPWPTLGATASQPEIDVSKVGRDGSMELMGSVGMLLFVFFKKGSLQATKAILTVWEGMEI